MRRTDPERWARVEEALDAALGTAPARRAELLDRLCAGDAALRLEVDSLLAAAAAAGAFLETTASSFAAPYLAELPEVAPEGDRAGTLIGRYRLLREIGRGGMGTVWLAERADGHFEQRVALKLIKRGMDSEEIQVRFLRERQILARLEHPSIARLLDGGVSEDGRPYFVMEFVQGQPITRYCDERQLSVNGRLRLFAAACRAVQYAHRSLVVHRDLKPSNVLVTGQGEIKLLDFGVAKLLGDEVADDGTAPEGIAAGLMTPEYASPEQVTGASITTSSDVYQLGVLLYELLTGRRPYGVAGRSQREIVHAVCESVAPDPSAAVAVVGQLPHRDGTTSTVAPESVSRQRSTTPRRLQQSLVGDLDTITLRALHKVPGLRYPSAEDLAEDIERHVVHRPLRFGGEGRRYRAGKFLRRHRTRLAVAASLGVLAVVLGTGYVMQIRAERDRARREEAKSSENANLLQRLFRGWSPDASDRQEMTAARMLGDATRRAESELGRDPETLASTLSVLGDLHASIGEEPTADSLLRRALAIQRRLPGGPSTDLAATLGRRGRLLVNWGRPREGEAALRQALAIYRSALPPARPEVLQVQYDLAAALSSQEKVAEAEGLLRGALQIVPLEAAVLSTEIAASLGYVLFLEARYQEASAILRPTLERQRRLLGRLHHSTFRTIRYLGSALRDQGLLDEAEALEREALGISLALFGPSHPETIATLMPLALVLERKALFSEAEAMMREVLVRSAAWNQSRGYLTGNVLRTLGAIRLAQGDLRGAEALLRRGLTELRKTYLQGQPDEGDILNRLAYCVVVSGDADAREIYRQAVEFEAARPTDGPYFVTDGYEYLAEAARRMGDPVLAERLFRRALALYERQLPIGHPYRVAAAEGLQRTLAAAAGGARLPN